MNARVVFLGTPEAAVPTLEAVAANNDVGLVVTRPDRPRGRSQRPVPPPVKEAAHRLGLIVAQPTSSSELTKVLTEHRPYDVGIVVAFGRILRPEVLDVPARGMLNVHFSLLPRWRGAAPVARALMADDPMTGVSIIRLDEGLDTGPVLTAQAVDIGPDESAGALTDRLAHLGARLLVSALGPYLSGDISPVAQSDEGVTYADKLEPADRLLQPAHEVSMAVNRVRALSPAPAATLQIDGERHKILELRRSEVSPPPGSWQVIEGFPIAGFAGGGAEIVRLQPPGRTPQSGADWVRGRHREGGVVG